GSIGTELLQAVAPNGIRVGEDDHAGVGTAAHFASDGENVFDAGAGAEGTLAGGLDHGTVGHRIAERHAEFDDVGSGFDGGKNNGDRRLYIGIAARDV